MRKNSGSDLIIQDFDCSSRSILRESRSQNSELEMANVCYHSVYVLKCRFPYHYDKKHAVCFTLDLMRCMPNMKS